MTTIAWDGNILAADKRAENGGLCLTVKKIHRLDSGGVFTGCGNKALLNAMFDWINRGCDPASFPDFQKSNEDYQLCVVITNKKELLVYERSYIPIKFEDNFYSCGSGRDFALSAMHCGKSAIESVEIAALFDCFTGNGVDYIDFGDDNNVG